MDHYHYGRRPGFIPAAGFFFGVAFFLAGALDFAAAFVLDVFVLVVFGLLGALRFAAIGPSLTWGGSKIAANNTR